MSSKRRRLVGPDFVAELAALAARANALSACLPAQPSESERDALAALQAACSGLEAAVAGSLEQSLLLRLPSELLVRALGFLDAAGMATVCETFRSGSTLVTEALPLAAARTASPATIAVVPRGRGEVSWLRCLEAAHTLADGWGNPPTTPPNVTASRDGAARDAAALAVLDAALNESFAHAPQRRLLGYANTITYHPPGVYSEAPTVELLRTNPAVSRTLARTLPLTLARARTLARTLTLARTRTPALTPALTAARTLAPSLALTRAPLHSPLSPGRRAAAPPSSSSPRPWSGLGLGLGLGLGSGSG